MYSEQPSCALTLGLHQVLSERCLCTGQEEQAAGVKSQQETWARQGPRLVCLFVLAMQSRQCSHTPATQCKPIPFPCFLSGRSW